VTGGDATSHVEGAVWRLWSPARPGGDLSVVGGARRQSPPPKYLQPGPPAGAQPTRCGPGKSDLRWGWAFPKWFSEPPYIACISSELAGFACFGRIWGVYLGRRSLGFGEGLLSGEAAFFVAV